jgi:type II secretion system protein J
MKTKSDMGQVTGLHSGAFAVAEAMTDRLAGQAGGTKNAAACEARSLHVSPVLRSSTAEGGRFTFHASAFTLVEIMVAMAIFSIVIAAIYSTWTLILRATQVGQNTAAQVQRERIALRTIEDSLTCVQSIQASMKYYVFTNFTQNSGQSELSFTARVPDVFPRNGRFGGFNLRRLTFSVRSGAENDLVLSQSPVLMDTDPDERQNPLVLARDVRKFTVECWDTHAMDWVKEWDDTNSIPALVRINLELGGGATPELAVTRLVAIPSVTLPSGLQTSRR